MSITEKWNLMLSSFADIKAAIIEKEGSVSGGFAGYANAVRKLYSSSTKTETAYPDDGDITAKTEWCKGIKEQIRLAIVDGGIECGTNIPFSEYGNRIRQIRGALQIVSDTLPTATYGIGYNAQLEAEGGVPPYTWSDKGDKYFGFGRVGLALSSDGAITGQALIDATDKSYTMRVFVTDSTRKSVEKLMYMSVIKRKVTFTVTNNYKKYNGEPQYATVTCNEVPDLDFTVTYHVSNSSPATEPLSVGTYYIKVTVPDGYSTTALLNNRMHITQ